MPYVPAVPHIVGDDDDLNDAEETSTKSPQNSMCATSASELNNHISDSSEHDDSSFEGGADDEGGGSSSSSAEEEGEDWSNNISYVVATPSRETEPTKNSIEENQVTSTAVVENVGEKGFDEISVIDITDNPSGSEMSAVAERKMSVNGKKISEQRPAKEVKEAEPAIEQLPIKTQRGTILKLMPRASQGKTMNDLSPISRRRSLRSANRSSHVKYVPSPKRIVRGRPRKTLTSKHLSPKTISGRVAKRANLKSITINSPSSKNAVSKAKPLDVTEYFSEISATLVNQRVDELPFQYLCKCINRLVAEALQKTNIQNNNNANDSST